MNKWVANILQHVYSNNIYAEYCHLLPQVACKSVVKGTRRALQLPCDARLRADLSSHDALKLATLLRSFNRETVL